MHEIDVFNKEKTRIFSKSKQKRNILDSLNVLYDNREIILNVFKSRIIPLQTTEGKGKIGMLARLVEVSNPLRPLDLARHFKILIAKQMFQRLLIALAHVLAGNTSENVFKRSCQILYILCTMQKKLLRITNVFPNFGMYYRWKNIKSHTKTKNLKYQLPRGIRKLNYVMDHILYQIFKIILNISLRNMGKRQISLQKEYM